MNPHRFSYLRVALALVSAIVLAPAAWAQTGYPSKPVVFVVPTAPGGAWDILGRALTHGLAQTTGKQYIVENRPGAGTVIGARSVAGSDPDGYTLLVAGSATLARRRLGNPSLCTGIIEVAAVRSRTRFRAGVDRLHPFLHLTRSPRPPGA